MRDYWFSQHPNLLAVKVISWDGTIDALRSAITRHRYYVSGGYQTHLFRQYDMYLRVTGDWFSVWCRNDYQDDEETIEHLGRCLNPYCACSLEDHRKDPMPI
jgi:hypothetical protein